MNSSERGRTHNPALVNRQRRRTPALVDTLHGWTLALDVVRETDRTGASTTITLGCPARDCLAHLGHIVPD